MVGNGNQFAIKSWYMPPHLFEKSILNLGRWSTNTELSFHLLDRTGSDEENETLPRGPLSRSQWDNSGRASLDIKKARVTLERVASKLFN